MINKKKGNNMIAGVDEVGRGPLAGPLITAAVILSEPIEGLQDSKTLSPKKREILAARIREQALCYAFGRASPEEIDELNIHQATLLAMKRAVENLAIIPHEILVDGLFIPKVAMPAKAIVRGDSLIQEIAAASIIAKVLRDEEMITLDLKYQGYGFKQHKGYPTKDHLLALKTLGPSAIHRRSFKPVQDCLRGPL